MILEAGGSEFKVSLGFRKTLPLKRSLRVLVLTEFNPGNPGGGREPTPPSCSLIPTYKFPKHTQTISVRKKIHVLPISCVIGEGKKGKANSRDLGKGRSAFYPPA